MFKKYLKVVGTSLLAIIMALTLTGCGEKQVPEAKEMVVWGFVDEDVFKPIIKDFNSSGGSIKIKYIKKNLTEKYENESLNSIMSGEGPDVWAIPNDWLYRHKDKLYPLPEEIIKSKKINFSNVADVVSIDNQIDKHYYGLTPGVDALQIYYNPSLLDKGLERAKNYYSNDWNKIDEVSSRFTKFPTTWGELNSILPWITERNGSQITTAGIAMGTSNNVSHPEDILSLLMLQNQTKMISEDLGQASFNLPTKDSSGKDIYPGTKALDFYTSYSNPSSPNYTWNPSMPNDVQAFINGKVAMIFGYSDLSNYLIQGYPGFNFSRALVPQIGDFNPIIDYSSYTTYTVPEISPYKTEAWNFILYLCNTGFNAYGSSTRTIPPFLTDSTEALTLNNRSSGAEPSNNVIQTLRTWNKGRYPAEVDNLFKDAISRVNSGSQSSQASLDTAATKLTELLRKEGW